MRTGWTACRAAIALGVALTGLASGCARPGSRAEYFGQVEPPKGQVLRYVSGSEPESLDPQVGSGQPEARIYLALFDGLTEMDPRTSQPFPSIAERWDVNADNSAWVFHLRHNARWSSGTPITARDFVYSIRRGLSPELASRNAYLAYDIQYGEAYNEGGVFVRDQRSGAFLPDPDHPGRRLVLPGDTAARAKALAVPALAAARGQAYVPVRGEDIGVEAPDDYTLCLQLNQPVPFLVGLMTHQFFRPVPHDVVDRYGEAWTQPDHIVTSGPFTVKTWRAYDKLVVVRNPMYWDAARVALDEITFYPLDDSTTMLNLYKAGEVDALLNHSIPVAWIDRMRSYKDYMDAPENASEYYMFNTTRAPTNDVRVRKAFNMAIDKSALARYKRTAKPLTSFVPEGIFPDYVRPAGDSFDPDRARVLLAAAGYRDAAGAYDASRFPVADVELTYNTQDVNRQVAEFVQAQWKQNLGLTIPLKNMEWKTFLVSRAAVDYKGISRAGWVGDYMDPFTFLNLFSTPGGDNGTGWWDPRFVAMLDEANRQSEPARRFAVLVRAEQYLLDVQPVIPLYTSSTNWVKKPYVKGMYANPVTLFPWKFVYIEHDPAKWDEDVAGQAH